MAIKAEPQSYILKAGENKEPSKTLMGINERRLKLGEIPFMYTQSYLCHQVLDQMLQSN